MKRLVLPILLLLGFLLLSFKLDKPFVGHHDWNGVFFGNVANNTAKFGFLKTKFGATYSFLPTAKTDLKFYTHYPPVFHLLLGLEAKIIGTHEWSMRLLAITFSLIALYYFFKIAQLLFNQAIAFIASLFFIFNPMFLYFGKMPVHEVFGLTFVTFSVYRYLVFFSKNNKKNYFWLIFSLILVCQTIWSGYYLVPLFIIHYQIFKKKKRKRIFLLILIPLFSFLGHLLHTFILTGTWNSELFSTMLFRMQIGAKAKKFSFTLIQYIKQEALWLSVYFTRILLLLNVIYYFLLAKKIIKKAVNWRDGILLIILIFPFIDPIIFRNVCWVHDYKLYYFLLSVPLLATVSLFWLKGKFEFLWKKNKLVSLFIFLVIFIFFATERLKFLKTLLNTSMNKPAYDLGLIIKEKTLPGQINLVGSSSFAEFLDLFLNFYSQRKTIYFYPDYKNFKDIDLTNVRLVIFIKSREKPSQELLNFLKNHYPHFESKDFLIFDLKHQ